jgi:ADP-ribose pyrophosphatase YjhB (NUDIX family)
VRDAEDDWLTWAKRLQALAATGAHFTDDPHHVERYGEIASLANAMLARLASVPVEHIEGLAPIQGDRYVTPQLDVRGAVFDRPVDAPGDARVLLVREAADGRWTLPGGYADVGLSAGENVVKEIAEEAEIEVVVARLYAVRHKAKHAYRPDVRDFYKLFFLCERVDDVEPGAGDETTDAGWFTLDALPRLSTGRTIEADVRAAFAHRAEPGRLVEFD